MTTIMEAPQAAPPGLFSGKYRALSLGLIALVTLTAFEAMAVATAMPVVARDLGGMYLYNLAFSGTLAASVIATVVAGRWGDVKGALAPMWTGLAGFALGLLVAGFAPSMEVLVAGRFLQGLGSGLFNVSLYVLVARVYPAETHAKVFSLFATAWILPSMIGPAVAGVVAEHVGWRWIFLGVLVLIVPFALAFWRGTAGQDLSGGLGEPAPGLGRKVVYATLTAVAAALIQYGSALGLGGLPVLALGLLLLAATLPKLLPKGTLRAARGLPTAVVIRGLANGSMLATEIMVPLLLMDARGLSAGAAGVVLTTGALGWSTGSWLKGRGLISHLLALRGGMAMIALGIAFMSLVMIDSMPLWIAYVSWTITGLGMGALYPTVSVLVLELSRSGEEGQNTASLGVGETVFTVVAVAITGALFTASGETFLLGFAFTFVLAVLGVVIAPRFTQSVPEGTMEGVRS